MNLKARPEEVTGLSEEKKVLAGMLNTVWKKKMKALPSVMVWIKSWWKRHVATGKRKLSDPQLRKAIRSSERISYPHYRAHFRCSRALRNIPGNVD